MKRIRQFCAAMALTLALTLSAFAGEMQTPSVTTPPPPASATGDIPFPGITAAGDMAGPGLTAVDPLTEIALAFMTGALSVF